jgi:hypothetical protein
MDYRQAVGEEKGISWCCVVLAWIRKRKPPIYETLAANYFGIMSVSPLWLADIQLVWTSPITNHRRNLRKSSVCKNFGRRIDIEQYACTVSGSGIH